MSLGFNLYNLIGIAFEERDLVGWHGEKYTEYRPRVGAIIPGLGKPT